MNVPWHTLSFKPPHPLNHTSLHLLCDHCSLPLTLECVWEAGLNNRMNEVWQRHSVCVPACACLYVHACLHTCLLSRLDLFPYCSVLTVEPKDGPGTDAAERSGGWTEPCRLGFYQYSPSRQPARQEMEQLTYFAC